MDASVPKLTANSDDARPQSSVHPTSGKPRRLSTRRAAAWSVAVASELASEGIVELIPVFQGKSILDFKFLTVCAAAAAFLRAEPDAFVNRTVRQVLRPGPATDRTVEAYRAVFVGEVARVHVGDGSGVFEGHSVLHHISRTDTGLSVTLTCPHASERKREAEAAQRASLSGAGSDTAFDMSLSPSSAGRSADQATWSARFADHLRTLIPSGFPTQTRVVDGQFTCWGHLDPVDVARLYADGST
jgi:hypothetical protein